MINGKKPKDVVFIHCVGSRDKNLGNEYCSRVCCMYTAKQAHLVREKLPEANITVFYMDVRAFGKGFEEFYDRVRMEGARYRRGNPSEIYRRGEPSTALRQAQDTNSGRSPHLLVSSPAASVTNTRGRCCLRRQSSS